MDASGQHEHADLLRRAAAGEEAAWRAIVEIYHRRVFGLLRAQCGDTELAEDITQSTFCTVVAKIGSYAEEGKFESWLFHIAMNRLRDEMRRRRRQARPVETDTLVGLAGPATGEGAGAGVSGVGVAGQDRAEPAELSALARAIDRLSEADREVVHLRHFAGLSFKQIAELLGQPLGTILARQHRALKKLRGILEGEHRAGLQDPAERP
jgi:RNA polymerase sigma-70 factor (ECF subfamily)